jgi:hypothetical protein
MQQRNVTPDGPDQASASRTIGAEPSHFIRSTLTVLRKATPLLAPAVLMLAFLTVPPAPPNNEADPSLGTVLSYAHQHGLQFGTQIVSTYGPLGFLLFPCFAAYAAGMRLAIAALLCYAVAAGLWLVTWRLGRWWGWCLPAVFIWTAANVEPRTDLVLDVGLFCWGLLVFVESGRRLMLAIPAFAGLAVFAALAKSSFLFAGSVTVLLLTGDLFSRGKSLMGMSLLLGSSAGFLAGWVLAGQKLGHLGSFLGNSWAIVHGYNEAQAWEGMEMVRRGGVVLALLALAMVLLRTLTAFANDSVPPPMARNANENSDRDPKKTTQTAPDTRPHLTYLTSLIQLTQLTQFTARFFGGRTTMVFWRRAWLCAWSVFLGFTVWKHGFVRGDAYHQVFFLGFVPVLALGLDTLPCRRSAVTHWARGLGVGCCLLAVLTLQLVFFLPGWRSLATPCRAWRNNLLRLEHPADYLAQMNASLEVNRRAAQLPRSREIIGRSSVDVFGQAQAYAPYNELNYRPRPIFQSYTACNERLMRLNEEFFLSPAAPEFVLFELGGVDRKFPALADARVLRDLLINYTMPATEDRFLLLQAKSTEQPRLSLVREGAIGPGQRFDLREFGNTNLWLEIELRPSLLGQMRKLLYQPPTVRLAAWGETAKTPLLRGRAPVAMLSAGFLASPLLWRTEDVQHLFAGQPVSHPSAYSVEVLQGEERFWRPTIRFRLYRIENTIGQ